MQKDCRRLNRLLIQSSSFSEDRLQVIAYSDYSYEEVKKLLTVRRSETILHLFQSQGSLSYERVLGETPSRGVSNPSLVCFAYLVDLVYLVCLVQPNKQDKQKKPNNDIDSAKSGRQCQQGC